MYRPYSHASRRRHSAWYIAYSFDHCPTDGSTTPSGMAPSRQTGPIARSWQLAPHQHQHHHGPTTTSPSDPAVCSQAWPITARKDDRGRESR